MKNPKIKLRKQLHLKLHPQNKIPRDTFHQAGEILVVY